MIKEQLIKKSPLRVLEKSLDGGLKSGTLGLLTARRGVGKTASLVHIATDVLLRGQSVLHVSFADDPKHIVTWYEQVFREVAKAYKLENALDVHDELIHHRLILHFKKADLDFDEIRANIEQVQSGMNDKAQVVIVDGFSIVDLTPQLLKDWHGYAQESNSAIWFSAASESEEPLKAADFSPEINDLFSVIIVLKPKESFIELQLAKSPRHPLGDDLHLKLDPRTLLISNYRA